MARFAPAFCILAAALSVVAPAAFAGGSNIGTVPQVPALFRSIGGASLPAAGPAFNAPAYPSFSGVPASGSMSLSGGVGTMSGNTMSGAPINVTNSDGVSVQTSIDSSRNIQAGSNVSLNETINGQPIGYGYSSADFLGTMNQADADAGDALAQRQADDQELENEALMVVQVWQGQGN